MTNAIAIKGFGNDIVAELNASAVVIPSNYNVANALKSAYLLLQEIEGKQGPALKVCTPVSIHNALLDMAVQGLNPAKKQCYFVVYGNKLQLIRSYMGSEMVAKRVNRDIRAIRARTIYEDDKLTYEIKAGLKIIGPHIQAFGNIDNSKIVGAYAMALSEDDKIIASEIMTIEEIKQAWRQSNMKDVVSASGVVNKDKVHGKFTSEMAKKTVTNRLCKKIISTTDDETLIQSIETTIDEATEPDPIDIEIKETANTKLIDFAEDQDGSNIVEPEVLMATEDHAKEIIRMEKAAGRENNVLETISRFVGREVKRLREVTLDEAERYLSQPQADIAQKRKREWA